MHKITLFYERYATFYLFSTFLFYRKRIFIIILRIITNKCAFDAKHLSYYNLIVIYRKINHTYIYQEVFYAYFYCWY